MTADSGAGISIEALSDSNVISCCSLLTVSPGFTSTSIIPTFLKSPISGTLTDITFANLDLELLDDGGFRSGDFDRSLVGFERDQLLFLADRIARFHQHFDNPDILEIPNIGHFDGYYV